MPLSKTGYRLFDIGGLAEEMEVSRDLVEILIIQPGFPYYPIPTYKKPRYLESAVAKYLEENVKYVHKV